MRIHESNTNQIWYSGILPYFAYSTSNTNTPERIHKNTTKIRENTCIRILACIHIYSSMYSHVLAYVFSRIHICIRPARPETAPMEGARATPHLSWVARSRGTSAVPSRVTKGTRAQWVAQWALRQLQSHLTACSHHNRSHNTAALTTQL